MKTQDLKWLAYARSFTSDVRTNEYDRSEFLWLLIGAPVVLAAVWMLINL